jgi:hypothetical protein
VTLLDVCAVSHFLSFLFPVAMLELLPAVPDPSGLYSFRLETVEAYSLAYFALTIGVVVAYNLGRRPRVPELNVNLPAEARTLRWLMSICLVCGLSFKVSLLSAGLYWRDTYGAGAAQYSGPLAPIRDLSAVGLLLAGYGAARHIVPRKLVVLLFLFEIAYWLPSGTRGSMAASVEMLGLGLMLGAGRIPWKILVTFAVTISVVSIAMGTMRSSAVYAEHNVRTSVSAATSDDAPVGEKLWALVDRLGMGLIVGKVVAVVPEGIPYLGMQDLERLRSIWIPRVVDPGRINFNVSGVYAERVGVGHAVSGSSPIMLMGEAYFRWGYAGVMGVYLVAGVVMVLLQRVCYGRNLLGLCMYALFIYEFAEPLPHTCLVDSATGWLRNVPLLIGLLYLLCGAYRSRSRGRRTVVEVTPVTADQSLHVRRAV